MKYYAGGAVRYPKSKTVVQLIEQAASRWPEAPAVLFAGQVLTYSQVNTRARWLAACLREMGVGAGDFIPLVMRNGPELPVAMLASMKLAAPFVPVDAAGPADVQASMIGALDPKVALCSPAVATVPPGLRALVVDASVHKHPVAGACLPRPATLDSMAYGFYTTGSTGAPKCALNVHLGLLNRFLYMSRRFGGGPDEIVLQNSRHVFDSSLWQMLWPLTTGSRVVIPDRGGVLDLAATIEIIRQRRVTMTDFVPSVFNMLVTMMRAQPSLAAHLTSLRRVLIGGEEANAEAVQAFRAALPGVAIINTYGPTEAAIGSVFHEVTDDDKETIPIGRPIDNTYAVIVDGQMEPVAPGEVGEILLGGDCLGLGYLKDPERTRAAFVENPFPDIPCARLYRTGDLGRRGDDGLLYFSGRTDQQVKIGGVRIELPDIELVLLRHPLVHEAKVIVQEGPGGKWLVAFVAADGGLDPRELRAHAAGNLAPGLVPKDIVVLERMPLNPNGKADRRELVRLAAARRQAAGNAAPLGDTERAVWRIWSDLLPVPPLTSSGDFFELGGDSLAAHRLALALSSAFGTAISVRDIAEAPTVIQQVGLLNGAAGGGGMAARRAQLGSDARLPADIVPPDQGAGLECRKILLTGATGFIGAQILHDLLARTAADVYCLVRADDAYGAQRRVLANLARYRLLTRELAGRIHAVCGDLTQPRLGLGLGDYRHLAQTLDTIVHTGALVNLARGYAVHRAANVTGTIGILRFATACRLKRVHHTSTLGAVLGRAQGHRVPVPEGPASLSEPPEGGYGQSKWAAERLLQQAAERGVPVTVYRLGEVMPHSVTGVPSPRGLADLLTRACLETGLCFTSSIVTDCTPVDWVSRVITAAICRGEIGYFHVRYPRPVAFDDLLDGLRREFGLPGTCYPAFWQALCALADDRPDDRELKRTLMLIPRADIRSGAELAAELASLFSDGASRADASNTGRLMADAGITWPELGDGVFRRYAAYHRRPVLTGEQDPRGVKAGVAR